MIQTWKFVLKNNLCVFSHIKHASFTELKKWDFLGENARIFNHKHILRFSTIFNSQTVYYTYVTNKKRSKKFRIIYSLRQGKQYSSVLLILQEYHRSTRKSSIENCTEMFPDCLVSPVVWKIECKLCVHCHSIFEKAYF